MFDYEPFVPSSWRDRLDWSSLTPEQRQAVGEFGSYMFGLASPTVSDIDEIKYGGRLVILTDGTRWEVDQYDSDSVEYWSTFSKVAVLDDVMYVIEDAEHATVSQEI